MGKPWSLSVDVWDALGAVQGPRVGRRCAGSPSVYRLDRSAPALTTNFVSSNLPFVQTYQDGLAAIGDPTRRTIFELLAEGPTPVGELAARLPVSRPAVSQHLRVLKAAGLVSDRAVGTRRLYQLDPAGVAAMRAYLDRFWTQALTDFKAVAEAASEPTQH
jgi:DNA-binding transcriptional ArsR family regulator